MSLARIYSGVTGLGQLIISKIGDVGGPPASRVSEELDNIIAWAKNAPRCIQRDTSTVGNVGAGLDTLHTFSLPAGSLATNGDYLQVEYAGAAAGNAVAGTKVINIQAEIDAQVNGLTGAVSRGQAGAWRYNIRYI